MTKLNLPISVPADVIANNFPVIARIAFAWVVAISRNFLIATERAWEDVTMKVFFRAHMRKSNDVAAFDLFSSLAGFSCFSFDHPMRVHLKKMY